MSLTPPNSAVLLTSLTRISAIESKEGNSSASGAEVRGPMLLMPSMLVESILGLVPTTEILPLASVCTPGCEVSVESGLVDPAERAVTAIGRSTSSRPVFVSAIFETSVLMTGAASAVTLTVSACVATVIWPSIRMVCRASS